MHSFNFVQTFTRADENHAHVYTSGYVVEAESREAAEAIGRERSAHLTVLSTRLAAILDRDGVVTEYHADGGVLTEAQQLFALRVLGVDIPAYFVGRAFAEQVLREYATEQNGFAVDVHPLGTPYSDSSISTVYPADGDSFRDAVAVLRRVF
jgi:hypothetical protein